MANPALYKLEMIADNPIFEGFAFVREESLRGGESLDMDFHPDDVGTRGRAWTAPRLAGVWAPQPVVGRVRRLNDYPCVNLSIPAFSRRAVDALRDLLEPNGELLPLVSEVGEYYAYNVTTVADVLDPAGSEFEWLGDEQTPENLFEILKYECHAERMSGLSIFRLVESCGETYVGQDFVDRVERHGLQGFHLARLWPLPAGVGWKDEDRKRWKREALVATRQGPRPVKGNTVVLRFATAKARPSEAERRRLAGLMGELDALLYDPGAPAEAPYLGSLEGDDAGRGELRIFVSCPDADALAEALRPWARALSWEGGVRVLKRYGEYVDPDCREEYDES